MAFRREIADSIGPVCPQEVRRQFLIADASSNKYVVWILRQGGKIIQVAGVCEFVEVDDAYARGPRSQYMARADEPGPSRYQVTSIHGGTPGLSEEF
jgi:hypothetical protein